MKAEELCDAHRAARPKEENAGTGEQTLINGALRVRRPQAAADRAAQIVQSEQTPAGRPAQQVTLALQVIDIGKKTSNERSGNQERQRNEAEINHRLSLPRPKFQTATPFPLPRKRRCAVAVQRHTREDLRVAKRPYCTKQSTCDYESGKIGCASVPAYWLRK